MNLQAPNCILLMFSNAFKYGYVVHLKSAWTWIYHFCNQDACLFPLVARSISMVVLVRWKELGVEKMDSMFMYIFQVYSKSTQILFLPFSVLSKSSHSTRCIYLSVFLGKNIERSHSLPVFFPRLTRNLFLLSNWKMWLFLLWLLLMASPREIEYVWMSYGYGKVMTYVSIDAGGEKIHLTTDFVTNPKEYSRNDMKYWK